MNCQRQSSAPPDEPRPKGLGDYRSAQDCPRWPRQSRPAALVLLNPRARAGTSTKRYDSVRPFLEQAFAVDTVSLDESGAWRQRVAAAIGDDVRVFVAAGGDGTVSALAGVLAALRGEVPLPTLVVGAVGLGSSNDFHKPFGRVQRGVPLRIDTSTAAIVPLMRVRGIDLEGAERMLFSLVSTSIGATARANARYNRFRGSLAVLKRRWTAGAIGSAALSAIASHVNVHCRLAVDGKSLAGPFANVSIARTPYLAGPLAYDAPFDRAGGRLLVNIAGDMNRVEVLAAFVKLARGRFLASPKTSRHAPRVVSIESDEGFDLEVDGEIHRLKKAVLDVCEEGFTLCGS